jgi:RimJ/RimL family protein N-acetyltransferase
MKDFPIFTTEYGVASLILREVPYRGIAYIRIQSTLEPEKLLEECVSFCRMVGAEKIYATGHEFLERYPFYTAVWSMACLRESLGKTDACLWPVTPETADRFREIYNEKIRKIPNAAWMDTAEQNRMVAQGDGYFVHRDGKLLGIGRVEGESLLFLASLSPGAGAEVLKALASTASEERLLLDVASENKKALALYERMGFLKTGEKSKWFELRSKE